MLLILMLSSALVVWFFFGSLFSPAFWVPWLCVCQNLIELSHCQEIKNLFTMIDADIHLCIRIKTWTDSLKENLYTLIDLIEIWPHDCMKEVLGPPSHWTPLRTERLDFYNTSHHIHGPGLLPGVPLYLMGGFLPGVQEWKEHGWPGWQAPWRWKIFRNK